MESKIRHKAVELLMQGNPYTKKEYSIPFYKGWEPFFICQDGKVYSKAELDVEYLKTLEKDIKAGYHDRKVGYYDKWYRYNRYDEGRGYDAGVRMAVEEINCPVEFHIIEVAC